MRVVGHLDPVGEEIWQKAKAKLSAEHGETLTDGEVMLAAAKLILSTRPEGPPLGSEAEPRSPFQVVLHQCPECRSGRLQTDNGLVPVDPGAAAEFRSQAEVVDVEKEFASRPMPAPEPGEDLAPKTPPWLRDLVLARSARRAQRQRAH